MSSVYAELGKLTHSLAKGNAKMPLLDAVLEAHRLITQEQCTQVGDEIVPFSMLEAMKKGRTVEVVVDGFRYAFGKNLPESTFQAVDGGNELLLVLQGPISGAQTGDPPRIKTEGNYYIRLDNSTNYLEGKYNLAEAEQITLRDTKPGKAAKDGFVKHIPLQGLVGQTTAAQEKLPLLELELFVTYSSSKQKPGVVVPTLRGVVVRVAMRPSKDRLRRGTLTRTDRRGLMPSDTQREPFTPAPAPQMNLADRTDIAKQMLGSFVEKGDTFSLMIVRDRKILVDIESGSDRAVYSAGEVTQVLTSVAIVKHIMTRPESHAAGEVNLHSRTLLADLLRESGATNVLAALEAVYGRAGVQLPSIAQLLTHTSGLPALAQPGLRDAQAMFADEGGLQATGSLEQDFAATLRNKVSLIGEPDSVYNQSALNYAIAMFALPGWDKNTSVLEMIREMANSTDGQVSFADMASETGYQGIYKLYAGLRSDVASLASALSLPGWYSQSSSAQKGVQDWLQKLAEPRVLVSREKRLAAGYGSWMNGVVDGTLARYAIGRYGGEIVIALQLPNSAATAVLGIRKQGAPLACAMPLVEALARTTKVLTHGGEPTNGRDLTLRLPARSRAAAAGQRYARSVLAGAGRVEEEDRDMVRWYGDEMVGLLDRDASITIKPELTQPDMTRRYVLTMHHNGWKQKWTVVVDDARPADPENPNGTRGGLRVIDPLSGALTEHILMGMIYSSVDSARAEPVITFMGRIFVRKDFAREVQGAMDPNSREAREREANRVAMINRQRERSRAIRLERRQRARAARSEGDQSSDEEYSDDDLDDALERAVTGQLGPNDDVGDAVVVKVTDLFERMRTGMSERVNGEMRGNWHRYIGGDRFDKKAPICAYPTGERIRAVNDYYY